MFSKRLRAVVVHGVALGGFGAASVACADVPAREALVAEAAVPWHADLAAAKRASLVSRRPVLVIFVAGSSESGAAITRDVFRATETVALLTACFEPVRIDIDSDASTARSMGIAQVPMACIVDADDRILTRFACPTAPATFVAAASRAAQEAAGATVTQVVTPVAASREHSDFVSQAAQAAPAAPATAPPAGIQPFSVPDDPTLPATPPAWPAEQATRPMPSAPESSAATSRPAIEPAASAAGNAAWLNTPPAAPAAGAVATAAPAAPAAPSAPATPAEPEKKSTGESFLAALQKPFTIFSKPKQPEAATPAPASAPVAVASTVAESAGPDVHGSMPLGLEGFCPVSLVDKGTWVEGRAQWGARHRGRTYLFAGPEQQRAFLTDPDRYAPALSGDDPVLACDSGRQVAGQRRYGVTYQARTYLFSSPETRAAFAANPQRYTARVMIAERPAAPGTVMR